MFERPLVECDYMNCIVHCRAQVCVDVSVVVEKRTIKTVQLTLTILNFLSVPALKTLMVWKQCIELQIYLLTS